MADGSIRIYIKVTGITAAHRRLYRNLRTTYDREMAHWVFAGYCLPSEAMLGPSLIVATSIMRQRKTKEARRG